MNKLSGNPGMFCHSNEESRTIKIARFARKRFENCGEKMNLGKLLCPGWQ